MADLQELTTVVTNDVTQFVNGEDTNTNADDDSDDDDDDGGSGSGTIRQDPATFTRVPADTKSFDLWITKFQQAGGTQGEQYRSMMDELLGDPISYDHYNTLVPTTVSANEFWQRYMYRMEQLSEDSSRVAADERMPPDESEKENQDVDGDEENVVQKQPSTTTTMEKEAAKDDELQKTMTTTKKKTGEETKMKKEAAAKMMTEESSSVNDSGQDVTKETAAVNNDDDDDDDNDDDDDDESTSVVHERSPSPKVVSHKMELASPPPKAAIEEDWELWE